MVVLVSNNEDDTVESRTLLGDTATFKGTACG
jgi:hypothetical protein